MRTVIFSLVLLACPLAADSRLAADLEPIADAPRETSGRSMFFDGTATQADLSTGANAALAADFSILFQLQLDPSVDNQVILSNQDGDSFVSCGMSFRYLLSSTASQHLLVRYRSDDVINYNLAYPISATSQRVRSIGIVLRDATLIGEQVELYVDGDLVMTSAIGNSAGTPSEGRLRVGFPEDPTLNALSGTVSDLAIFSSALPGAKIRAYGGDMRQVSRTISAGQRPPQARDDG